jgi:flagellar hook-associated protein 1 FlgK
MAIDITGQNITNADVEGYSRKRLNQTTLYSRNGTFGQIGMGSDIVNIERIRSAFLDQQIRRQNTEVGYFAEVVSTFNRVETVLCEPSELGIMKYVDDFFNSWHNLANNPQDTAARTMVRTEAQTLVEHFNRTAAELADLRQQKNDEIPLRVNRVNQIAQELLNLNHEVASVEIGNQNANDSRDKRDRLLHELSQIIDINVMENSLGQITVTTGGHVIVSPHHIQKLETTTTTIQNPDGTTRRDVGIRFADTKLDYNPPGGQIRGLIDSRDIYIPEYQKRLDELAVAFVKTINAAHEKGYSLEGFTGISFFDPNVTGASDIKISAAINSNVRNIAAASGGQVEVKARNTIPDNGGYKFGDEQPFQIYQDPSANTPIQAKNIIANSVTVNLTTTNGGTVQMVEGVDYEIDYATGAFRLLREGIGDDPDNLDYVFNDCTITIDFSFNTTGSSIGPGDNSNALAISELRNALSMVPNAIGEQTVTFAEFYSSVIGRLGLNTNQSHSNLETRLFLADQYVTQQDMIAGVSLDEEMANLIRYQHTYTAAARLISTVDKMIETLLNL